MSSPFLGQILTSIIARAPMSAMPGAKAPEVPLERLQPGAWAAWAKAARDEAAAMAAQPAASPVPKDRHVRVAHGLRR